MATKKKQAVSVHDLDRIIVRLPEGMRERVAELAAANGRSMTAEVVAALENHLEGTDRITMLWDFFQRHRNSIDQIPLISAAVENLENHVKRGGGAEFIGGLQALRRQQEERARLAALPVVTAEEARRIRALLKETGRSEEKFAAALSAPSIEEIRGFERAIQFIESIRSHDADKR